MYHPKTCCCVCSWSRIGRAFHSYPRGTNHTPYAPWTWLYPTTHLNPYWQYNSGRNSKQYNKKANFKNHGNAIFLAIGSTSTKKFKFSYQPGQENMGDYPTKHHTAEIHQHVRPYYLHFSNSPTTLLCATKPSARQGCAEILGDPYHKQVPIPSIPAYHAQKATT